jgi:hypothetical protein
MSRAFSLALSLALLASCAGSMFDVGKSYRLNASGQTSVIYGKARHYVPRDKAVNVHLKNLDTGATYMLAVRSSLSAAPENDFAREIDPGRWVIDHAETSGAVAPGMGPNAEGVQAANEAMVRKSDREARPSGGGPVFVVPPHTLVYVGTWDFATAELRVLDEKLQQDAVLAREHPALDPVQAVVATRSAAVEPPARP